MMRGKNNILKKELQIGTNTESIDDKSYFRLLI